jgi:hypothetical protein
MPGTRLLVAFAAAPFLAACFGGLDTAAPPVSVPAKDLPRYDQPIAAPLPSEIGRGEADGGAYAIREVRLRVSSGSENAQGSLFLMTDAAGDRRYILVSRIRYTDFAPRWYRTGETSSTLPLFSHEVLKEDGCKTAKCHYTETSTFSFDQGSVASAWEDDVFISVGSAPVVSRPAVFRLAPEMVRALHWDAPSRIVVIEPSGDLGRAGEEPFDKVPDPMRVDRESVK